MAVGARHWRRTAAIAAAFMLATTVSCSSKSDEPSSAGNEPAVPSSSEAAPKPDFTQVTGDMFVPRTALLNGLALAFTPPDVKTDAGVPNDPVTPPECGPFFWGPTPIQSGSVTWSAPKSSAAPDSTRDFKLFLTVPKERTDFASLLGQCQTIEYQGSTVTMTPLPLPGVPPWAVATRTSTELADRAGIIGLYRGLYISVSFTQSPPGELSPDDTNALARLFSEQVAKLDAT